MVVVGCRHGLNETKLYEMAKLRKQFSRILSSVNLAPAAEGPEPQHDPEHSKVETTSQLLCTEDCGLGKTRAPAVATRAGEEAREAAD